MKVLMAAVLGVLAALIGCTAIDSAPETASGTSAEWDSYVQSIENAYQDNAENLQRIVSLLQGQEIYKVSRGGKDGLRVQATETSSPEEAPQWLQQKLYPLFQSLSLHSVKVAGQRLQVAPAGGGPSYKDHSMFMTFDYFSDTRPAEICSANTIDSTPEGGHCRWPLPGSGWYAHFIWAGSD